MLHDTDADVESALEEVESLFKRLGPVVPDIVRVVQLDKRTWSVTLDNDIDVTIEWSDMPPRLVFITEIGCPPAEREMDVYRASLTFNLQSADTGGAKIALSEEYDQMMLMFELPAQQLSTAVVGDFLTWFSRQAGLWREFVTASRGDPLVNPGNLMNCA